MPSAKGALRVSVDQINRAISGAFHLNGNVGTKAGFAAATFL
jgi:hypothetical protein